MINSGESIRFPLTRSMILNTPVPPPTEVDAGQIPQTELASIATNYHVLALRLRIFRQGGFPSSEDDQREAIHFAQCRKEFRMLSRKDQWKEGPIATTIFHQTSSTSL